MGCGKHGKPTTGKAQYSPRRKGDGLPIGSNSCLELELQISLGNGLGPTQGCEAVFFEVYLINIMNWMKKSDKGFELISVGF